MNKLVLCAAVAALAGAAAASATQPVYSKHANFDAGLSGHSTQKSLVRKSLSSAALASQTPRTSPLKAGKSSKPRFGLASQPTLSNETDAALGVDTFIWADSKAKATPLTPIKAGQRVDVGARAFLSQNSAKLGLSKPAIDNAKLVEQHDTKVGPIIARYQQTQDGLEVFGRQINVMMDRNLRPVAASGYFAPQEGDGGRAGIAARQKASFSLGVTQAVSKAFADLGGSISAESLQTLGKKGAYTQLRAPSNASGKLALNGTPRGKQVLFPADGKLVPAWYVELSGKSLKERGGFAYSYVISAKDGAVLFRKNLTENEAFTYRTWADASGENRPYDSPLGSDYPTTPLTSLDPNFAPPRTPIPGALVTLDHGPISTSDPWLAAGATETVGNNVDAYIDLVGQPGEDPEETTGGYDPSLGDYRAAVTSPGVFDYSYEAGESPITDTARRNAIVNLFYVNNWLHDYWYDAGFNEAAGNAQTSNYGRGGSAGDPIQAQAQDWGGRNNANMTTPADGASPTMQMYLFDGAQTLGLNVTTPALGSFNVGTASFGPTSFSAAGAIVATVPADGCSALTNAAAVAGKIAFINRGTCGFQNKANAAEAAGAIGVIIANVSSSASPTVAPGMGATDGAPAVGIGSVSLNLADGNTVRNAITAGTTNGSVAIPTSGDYDGTVDNGIVAHEFFHYVSNRLINNGSGLVNQQGRGMGEGWSDVASLLLTVHEGDDSIPGNANFGGAYSAAAYATGSPYFGIRRAPYSVDADVFPMTFKHIQNGVALPNTAPLAYGQDGASNAEVHNSGEIWANTLWTFYVALLNDSRYTFDEAQQRFKSYLIASLKMTPYAPTFLEARDAVLATVKTTDQTDFELAATAFAKMGMGVGAKGPDRSSTTNIGVTESYVALAASFEITDVELDFAYEDGTYGYHDLDGVLDAGETAKATVTIHSTGTRDLSQVSATITSDGDVSYPQGSTITFPEVDADGNATTSFLVKLNSAPTASELTFTMSFPEIGATPDTTVEPDAATLTLIVNYDIQHNVFDTDEVNIPLASRADWTASFLSGGSTQWDITDQWDVYFGNGNGWYIPDNPMPSDAGLVSPVVNVGSSSFSFSFDSYWQFENAGYLGDGTPVSYDGGKLEISVDGGDFVDVLQAGGSFTEGGYNGYVFILDPAASLGAPGFADFNYDDFSTTTVSFGTSLAGKSVRFRFRAVSDITVGEFGWLIDNLRFAGITNLPFSDLVPDGTVGGVNRPVHAVVPANFSAPERAAGSTEQATITLAGGAQDLDGLSGVTYAWAQVSGTPVTLTNAATATASFTAPRINADTALVFGLTVSDGESTDTKTVTVTVTNVESPPVVTVPADFSTPERAEGSSTQAVITLSGSAEDLDGNDGLTYAWTQVSGPTVSLVGADTATASFVAPNIAADTQLRFAFSVSDGTYTETKTVTVTLLDVNWPPVAIVPADFSTPERAAGSTTQATVRLIGAAEDLDGIFGLTYSWTQVSGPAVELSAADTAVASFTAPDVAADTAFVFALTVSDGQASDTRTVTVTITNVNWPPSAIVPANFSTPERAAGSNTQATVTLSGGAQDLDGLEGISYVWTQTAGPAVTLSGANTATASFTAPAVAADTALTFTLTVSDGVASDTKPVTVTITNVNLPATGSISGPVRVGAGRAIELTGTASDPDGAITYQWSQSRGPQASSVSGADSQTATFVAPVAGNYVYTLTVTDTEGVQTSFNFPVQVIGTTGSGSLDWLFILAGLAAFGARRRFARQH